MLMMELNAYPAAVEIWESEQKATPQSPINKNRILSLAQTAVGSTRDILKLSDWGKGALTVFGEVCDIFKSR